MEKIKLGILTNIYDILIIFQNNVNCKKLAFFRKITFLKYSKSYVRMIDTFKTNKILRDLDWQIF